MRQHRTFCVEKQSGAYGARPINRKRKYVYPYRMANLEFMVFLVVLSCHNKRLPLATSGFP